MGDECERVIGWVFGWVGRRFHRTLGWLAYYHVNGWALTKMLSTGMATVFVGSVMFQCSGEVEDQQGYVDVARSMQSLASLAVRIPGWMIGEFTVGNKTVGFTYSCKRNTMILSRVEGFGVGE